MVVTLLVMALLSTIAVAFIQAVSMERAGARSVANRYQAELIADAAQADAIAKLKFTTLSGPMSTVWDLDSNGAPYLFLANRTIAGGDLVTERIPLFSTVFATNLVGNTHFTNFSALQINLADRSEPDVAMDGTAVSRTVAQSLGDVSVNINSAFPSLPNGLVGLLSAPGIPINIPANWIYVRDKAGRITGRYAYWLDDECSKLDLRYVGQPANAAGSHIRGSGTSFSDLSLLPLTNLSSSLNNSNLINNLLSLTNQANLPVRMPGLVKLPLTGSSAALTTNIWHSIRPYVTTFSLHDDRSPNGKRRLNLNEVVTTTTSASEVEQQTFAIRDAITNNLPSFGLRYYSTSNSIPSSPTPEQQEIYATKIAANIRDFIDADSTATVISADKTAFVSQEAGDSFIQYDSPTDANLPLAFGKEQGPFLSEYLRLVRVIEPISPTSTATSTGVTIRIRFAHYVELFNPTSKTITYEDLGPNPYVMISNRTPWLNNFVGGTPSNLELNDIKLFLPENFSIAPGGYAVLTNDGPPWRDRQTDYIGMAANRFLCRSTSVSDSIGQWEFIDSGGATTVDPDFEDYSILTSAIGGGPVTPVSSGGRYNIELSTGSSYSDQTERLSFGNDDGLIDYSLKIYSNEPTYVGRNNNNPALAGTFLAEETASNNTPTNNSNEARFSRGDPRSNTEVSKIQPNSGSTWRRTVASYGSGLTNVPPIGLQFPASPRYSTIGSTNYEASQNLLSGINMWRYGWSEFTTDAAGNHFVKNTNIFSVGELGSVFDPARYDINRYRSVGSTLRIGQPDSQSVNRLANTNLTSAMNWLGGRGSSNATSTNYFQNAHLLLEVFRTDSNVSGRVNPNSIIRDTNAVAFRAAVGNFTFSSAATNQASETLSGRLLNANATVAELRNFFTNKIANGFITSVGDLSHSPIFWSTNQQLAGVSMRPGDGVSDAGREEFLRNTANLLTTQSLAYTIFIKAQTGRFVQQGGTERFEPSSSVAREVVVQLQPEYPTPPDGEPSYTPVAPSGWRTLIPYKMNHQ